MAILDFPASPTIGQTYTANGSTWTWDGASWNATSDGLVLVTTSSDASNFKVPFANTTTSTTGNYGLLQDTTATFTYNPSTNTLVANTFSGALSGNASTATTWQTARTLWGQSVNGSADITAPLYPAAGTAALPAFSTSGDTDTGMWFPAADTIAFTEGGVESMRIDSSGNVGIGTTSLTSTFTVQGTPAAGTVSFKHAGNNSFGTILTLETISGTDAPVLSFKNYNGGSPVYYGIAGTNDGALAFKSGAFTGSFGTERMRIDSSGNLLVGTTATIGNGKISVKGDAGLTAIGVQVGADGNYGIQFQNAANSNAGYIQVNTSSTTYSTSSDYRLKENVTPMTGALAKVAALKPVTYTWKADGSAGQGFIAHELQAVVPDCVTGAKDAVDKDGKPKYQGVDTSFLVATLVAALQEQQALIQDLTTRLTALEGN